MLELIAVSIVGVTAILSLTLGAYFIYRAMLFNNRKCMLIGAISMIIFQVLKNFF